MKDRVLTFLALAVSVTALGYAAWVHSQADTAADAALRRREKQLVEKLAPKVQAMYQGLGVTNKVEHPTTLDQLFAPYVETMNRMVNSVPSETETNR